MNKLLRNPWVVGALVIGMAALWWVQMRSIIQPSGASADDAPAAVVATAATDGAESPLSEDGAAGGGPLPAPGPDQPLQPTALRWEAGPVRDPFGPVNANAAMAAPAPGEAEPVAQEVVQAPPALPILEAVLNTPSAHIAVIDGRMVRVGDRVSGRPVLNIDTASVALGRGADTAEPLLLRLPAR